MAALPEDDSGPELLPDEQPSAAASIEPLPTDWHSRVPSGFAHHQHGGSASDLCYPRRFEEFRLISSIRFAEFGLMGCRGLVLGLYMVECKAYRDHWDTVAVMRQITFRGSCADYAKWNRIVCMIYTAGKA